jgi:sugar/nucleoside kinase (ribokinase family)
LPISGETMIATETFIAADGKGANQAAARLGATVAMIGLVGNDSHAGWH